MSQLVKTVAEELSLPESQIRNTIKLLVEDECTIPFVARYRKETTGSLDEVQLRAVRDRYQYHSDLEATKERYLKQLEALAAERPDIATTLGEIRTAFAACKTKQEVEDLYLPYKPKRRTRAQIARERGLLPLLESILKDRATLTELLDLASNYLTPSEATLEDEKLRVKDPQTALQGAADILAEQIAETSEIRSLVRSISNESGELVSRKAELGGRELPPKKRAALSKYQNYFDYREPLEQAAGHRIMAVRRGESEKLLKLSIAVDEASIVKKMTEKVVASEPTSPTVSSWLEHVVEDSYRRLLAPSIESEMRLTLKKRAEEEAIKVFTTNLENLLLLPPVPDTVVLGVDPGFRTGSKLAVISREGKLLEHATIYPEFDSPDGSRTQAARETIDRFLRTHGVEYIAIGNGTGSREIGSLVKSVLEAGAEAFANVKRLVVNESGASVYSTDDVAREEFPDLDPTIRSAVSIARRLQDPLAELVKIDPKSIGVGQYQHDCHPVRLSRALTDVVESCVNRVGVNLNTASYKLLEHVSGIGPATAKNIVTQRNEHGPFASRNQLLDIGGFGPKAFEQCAGFLRVPQSENPLDNSGVHPERYDMIEQIAQDLSIKVSDLIGKTDLVGSIPVEKYVNETVGMPTLLDIIEELKKPGRDPRADGVRLHYSDTVTSIDDLNQGMKLKGTVSNVTNFGAFVDIGVHQDGLVHVSELADKFVSDPSKVVSVGQVVEVTVIDVDLERQRISLSCRSQQRPPRQQQGEQRASNERQQRPRSQRRGTGSTHQAKRRGRGREHDNKSYSVGDLLSKFNIRN